MRWRPPCFLALPVLASRLGAATDLLIPNSSAGAAPAAAIPSSVGPATLVCALVCAVAGAWLLWRSRRQGAGRASKGNLLVAESRSLGNRQYLVVAAYGKQKFLIGVCAGRISLLAPLDGGNNPPVA